MLALLILPLWLALLGILSKRFTDLRDSFMAACAIWGVALVALTEGLSLFNAISFWPVLNSWLSISFGAAVFYFFSKPEAGKISRQTLRFSLRGDKVPVPQLVFVSGICLILLMTGCVALVSAPNNWDSMTYHLTRVLNWMDHHSLRNYPTHDQRQLYLGPWAGICDPTSSASFGRRSLLGLRSIFFYVWKYRRRVKNCWQASSYRARTIIRFRMLRHDSNGDSAGVQHTKRLRYILLACLFPERRDGSNSGGCNLGEFGARGRLSGLNGVNKNKRRPLRNSFHNMDCRFNPQAAWGGVGCGRP